MTHRYGDDVPHRCEVTLLEYVYCGDRDEREVEFTVAGKGDTPQEAIWDAVMKMCALGRDPRLCGPESAS